MPKALLAATPVLAGVDISIGANRLRARTDLAIVSVAVPLGGEEALKSAFRVAWNLELSDARLSRGDERIRVLGTAPDQMMLIFPHATPDANAVVQSALKGAGYTTDQTDAWAILEISGPGTLSALERLCPHDLSRHTFPTGAFARTVMEHMGAIILRTGDESFLLLTPSSSARSFLETVETSFAFTAAPVS